MQVKVKVHAQVNPTPAELEDPTRSLSGILYIEVGDTFYPAKNSGTHAVEHLERWIYDAMKLVLPDTWFETKYLEGSYTMCLRRTASSDDTTIRLYDHDGPLMGEHIISYRRYLAALRGAAKSVLNEISERGLNGGPCTDALRDRLTHLERLEADIKTRGLP